MTRRPVTPIALTVAVTTAGVLLLVFADDSSRWAQLGAGVASAGLLGVLVVWMESALAERAREFERTLSLAAAPEPVHDTEAAQLLERAVPEPTDDLSPGADPVGTGGPHYSVEYEGWMRDSSRIDADQVRLRVFRDGEYFQFFVGVVPGIDFRIAIHGGREITFDQFKRAVTEVTAEQAVAHLSLGQAPLEDPTKAIELLPDLDEAGRRATHAEDASYEMGDVIATWRDDA